jgi:hypothetical protein
MITWVGITNTFLASIASLLTAVATLVYVIRSKKANAETQQNVADIKQSIEATNGIPPVTPQ